MKSIITILGLLVSSTAIAGGPFEEQDWYTWYMSRNGKSRSETAQDWKANQSRQNTVDDNMAWAFGFSEQYQAIIRGIKKDSQLGGFKAFNPLVNGPIGNPKTGAGVGR